MTLPVDIHVQNSAAFCSIAPTSDSTRLRRWCGCSGLALILYVGFCLALATASYLRPLPTFDRYLYAGAVASLRYSDPIIVHRIARTEFDVQPSPFRLQALPPSLILPMYMPTRTISCNS